MSLMIYCGSRIEALAEKLKELLLADRQGADPFAFSKVVVPNGNVAKWLQLRQFAPESSLCAGIAFPFMEKRLAELMIGSLPGDEKDRVELIPDHAYAKAIASILLSDDPDLPERDKFAPFREYVEVLKRDQRQAAMTWQLADKLADLMDTYEVHRPEIVEAWLTGGKDAERGATEAAEAALARALWGENGRFSTKGDRLSLRQLYNRVKDLQPAGNPQKIYFFGQSTFSLLQTQILAWLARKHEVEVFAFNPCREYWGDITKRKEDRELLRGFEAAGNDPEANLDCENDLLKAFGIAGRETLRLLVDLEEENGEETDTSKRIDFVWESVDADVADPATVLGKVQESIRGRTRKVARCRQDASVQVIGTPGIRREVEMVYNSILGSVVRPKGVTGERPWADCSFSDVAVIVPDMKTYRSVIENVFGARGEVPYGLLDTSVQDDSRYLQGFFALIELGRKGLNRERLFNVLENPCVQLALGFSRADVIEWRSLTEKIGAFDGFEHDPDKGCFDWSWALRRLRLAQVANSLAENGAEVPLVKVGGEDALKLSEVVELLHRDLVRTLCDDAGKDLELPLVAEWKQGEDGQAAHRGDCWAERLNRLAKTFLEIDKDDRLESEVRRSFAATLYSLEMITGRCGFELAVAAVEHFVGGIACNKGRYLTDGVTIGGFQSLSTLPFKQVYMMGMGAGGFPGRTSSSTLDIRGTGWRLGDVSAPNRNRFQFLGAVMSVCDRLVVSYPNRDIEKDAELFPAGIVREFEKFIGGYVLDFDAETPEKNRAFKEFANYPLLERGETGPRKAGEKRPVDDVVWDQDDPDAGLLPTYSRAARQLANERIKGEGKAPTAKVAPPPKIQPRVEISAKVLAEFLKDPVRAVMRHRFGIGVAGYLETDLDPDSPLGSLNGPDKWNLEAKWLASEGEEAVKKGIQELRASGKMPVGFLGAFAEQKILENKDGVSEIQAFIGEFALSEGEKNTLHLDVPLEFGKEGAEQIKTRLVAEVPNWKDENGVVSVLVTGWLGEKIPGRPPECCLQAFLAYLMSLRADVCKAGELKVGVVDVSNGTTGAWIWKDVNAEKAGAYLESLVRDYLKYEQTGDRQKLISLRLKDLLKKLNDAKHEGASWPKIHEALTTELENVGSDNSFNNELVIEQNLERFRRDPTAAELERIFKDRYELPLGGTVVGAAEKEAGNE